MLALNVASGDKRRTVIRENKEAAKKGFVVEREGEDPRVKAEFGGGKS